MVNSSVKNRENRGGNDLEVYIVIVVFYFGFFIWLSMSYIRYGKDGVGDSKKKSIYVGFLLALSLFYFISNILFDLEASYGLAITTLIIILFSLYMLKVVVKDKRSGKEIEEIDISH
jgi:hypothetical protein